MKTKILFSTLLIWISAIAYASDCVDNDSDWYVESVNGFNCTLDNCDLDWNSAVNANACSWIQFKKWFEPVECDSLVIADDWTLFEKWKFVNERWKEYNPKKNDIPNNWKDENCDHKDWNSMIASWGRSIEDIIRVVVNFISTLAVWASVIVFIYWWILYSSASWDDMKLAKARKAIIWSVVWLMIWVFAPYIIWWVIDMFS